MKAHTKKPKQKRDEGRPTFDLAGLTKEQLIEWHTTRSRFELQSMWNQVQPKLFDTTPPEDISIMSLRQYAQHAVDDWQYWQLSFDCDRLRRFFCLRELDQNLAHAINAAVFSEWEMTRDIDSVKSALHVLASFIYAHPAFREQVGPFVYESECYLDPNRRQQRELELVAKTERSGATAQGPI